jgi:hypothetical protein
MTRSSHEVASDQAAREQRERLDRAHERMLRDIRHRPEDSSPGIRRLLGRDQPPRPRRAFESRLRMDGSWESVDVGPAAESRDRPRSIAAPSETPSDER